MKAPEEQDRARIEEAKELKRQADKLLSQYKPIEKEAQLQKRARQRKEFVTGITGFFSAIGSAFSSIGSWMGSFFKKK